MKQFKRVAAVCCLISSGLMAQRAPVNLGTAGNYVILSETGITDVPPSAIVGNIAASPITGAAIHVTCAEVTGTISAVDAAGPAPCSVINPVGLTTAIGDLGTAYTDAAGRTIPDFTELGAGDISGRTLAPGLYKWSTGVSVDNRGVTLSGGPNAVWIFQVAGDILLAANAHINLTGGAQANNVFWQAGGPTAVTVGTGGVFRGNILSAKQIILLTGASLIGRALATTQVVLQQSPVTSPGPLVGGVPVLVAPTVTSTSPANLAPAAPLGSALTATFSQPMNPATITGLTFTLRTGGVPVAGAVTYSGVTATFTPAANLVANAPYAATITTGAQDSAGVALAANFGWTFTAGTTLDITPPTVSSTVPALGAINVPTNNALSATFSKPMNPATINAATFTLKQGLTVVAGVVSYSGLTATFTPAAGLTPNVPYTATITTGATDLAGNPLAVNFGWGFTTGAVTDTTPPTVSFTVPAFGAIGVPPGNALSATFSKPLNPATINAATFTLRQGGSAVAGTVAYAGVTATFTPTGGLSQNAPLTATISTGVTDLAGNALVTNYIWNFTTGSYPVQPTLPSVTLTTPLNGALNVPIGNALSATFNEALNPLTINTSTFSLKQGNTAVAGTVTYAGVTATFTPSSPLAQNLPFTATITTGVTDLAGDAMGGTYTWNFTTGANPDTTPPTVISTVPVTGAASVPIGNALSATFSKAMNPLTVSNLTFTVKQGATSVAGTVVYAGVTATFTPTGGLAANAAYTATIATGVTDLAGNKLASNYVWSFNTGAIPDTTPPTVTSTLPASGATLVTLTTNMVASFSKAMNPLTITTGTFTLSAGTTPVQGTVTYSGTTATFRPIVNLAASTTYTATVTNGATDLAGNSLQSNYVWTFTTGTVGGQSPVCLPNFAVLSGSSIINSGPTAVTGDIGVGQGGAVTGFPPGTLTGTTHTGDAAAALGIASLSAAYADAVARSVGPVVVTGDLGGQTFTAGIYKSLTSLSITAGNVTLDAKGDVNAVFIFQMGNNLTTAAGTQIVLAGGAQGFNVFWQVGTSALLGSNSAFTGSILANQSITLGTGAAVNGRLAAISGPVTLQTNVITSPAPSIAAGAVLNAASWTQSVAAGSIAAVFGNNLASSLLSATSYPLPTTLGGASFAVGALNAPLYLTSCGQANVQIPWEVAGQTNVTVTGTVGGQVSAPQPLSLAVFAPGIFTLNQAGSGQGAIEIAPTAVLAAAAGTGARPVAAGEYIAIFCTGLGPVSNQPASGAAALSNPLSYTNTLPTVTIGGVNAQVTYSGLAPGFAGLYQVNAVVPQGTPSGGSIGVVISIGGVSSNTATIAVQ